MAAHPLKVLTRFQQVQEWVKDWSGCTRCPLHKTRTNVVHGRGAIGKDGVDVLFIGEAPGDSEDICGEPFIGPAGQVLDQIIAQAVPEGVKFAICNLVGCIPRTGESVKAGEPDYEDIAACRPRLERFVKIADPKLIVTVGKLAREHIEPGLSTSAKFHKDIPMVDIIHPAAILRLPWAARGLAVRKCIVTISKAVQTHVQGVAC